MEKADLVYLITALAIISLLGIVVKPAIPEISMPFFKGVNERDQDLSSLERTTPVMPPITTPSPAESPVSRAKNPSESSVVQEIAGANNNTISLDYPILPESRPHPPEEAIRSPIQNSSSPNATPVFSKSYNMRYSSAGYVIEAKQSPLVIDFVITPRSENMNPSYTFFIATVRDPLTMRVIEEEGFGRQYSMKKDKQIVIYNLGRYHLTLYGNDVDVVMKIYIGDTSVIRLY